MSRFDWLGTVPEAREEEKTIRGSGANSVHVSRELLSTTARGAGDRPTVLAMVLTYNSPENLACSIRAIGAQTRPPEALLVIDNASDTPASQVLEGWNPPVDMDVKVLSQAENTGPGGGWAKALEHFRSSAYELGWLLDDDVIPPPDCLAVLLDEAGDPKRAFLIPAVRQLTGETTMYPAWHGVLLSRDIVETVGLPREDFFWWNEDTEYLMWRIPRAGYPLRHTRRVIVEHAKGRAEWGIPPWKYYYEARNVTYYRLHVRRSRNRLPRKLAMLAARALLREKDKRLLRLGMMLRGISDGIAGRLGRRVDPVL